MLALKELLHNLKDRDWDVNPTYSIDENEAKKLIQALEETNKKIADYTYMIGLLQDRIKEIEKSDKWIPVSKRLPEYGQDVWIQVECERIGYIVDNKRVKYDVAERVNYKHPQFNADYYLKGKVAYNPSDIIAWQPLPQPYKAESEDKE